MNARLETLADEALEHSEVAEFPAVRLMEVVGHTHAVRFTADDYTKLCEIARQSHLGVEPDPQFTGFLPQRTERVVIFRLTEDAPDPSEEFRAAAAVLGLATAVATVDEDVDEGEKSVLEAGLEDGLSLTRDERIRLRAWLRWLLVSSPKLRAAMLEAKERLLHLREEERRRIAEFSVQVAAADGVVHLKEMGALEKIYRGLDLPQADLNRHLNELRGVHVFDDSENTQSNQSRSISSDSDASSSRKTDALIGILFGD